MRLVLDTNVVVSALIWGGKPFQLLRLAIDHSIDLFTSPVLVNELREVLRREKFTISLRHSRESLEQAVNSYAAIARLVTPASVPRLVRHDADDDHVVAAAMSSRADLIVSGDHHLLTVRAHEGVLIVTASHALDLIAAMTNDD